MSNYGIIPEKCASGEVPPRTDAARINKALNATFDHFGVKEQKEELALIIIRTYGIRLDPTDVRLYTLNRMVSFFKEQLEQLEAVSGKTTFCVWNPETGSMPCECP